jgi:hypothetical protein
VTKTNVLQQAGMLQEEDDMHIEVEDAFERCAMHALADFHSVQSASVEVSTGRSVRLRCSGGRIDTSCAATRPTTRALDPPATETSSSSIGASMSETALGVHSPTHIQRDVAQQMDAPQITLEPSDVAAATSPARDSQAEKESADARQSAASRAGGNCSLEGQELEPGSQIPFTAVDVVAVLQEERQAQSSLGRHADVSLTVAALMAHRQEHLPAEMCHDAASPRS